MAMRRKKKAEKNAKEGKTPAAPADALEQDPLALPPDPQGR